MPGIKDLYRKNVYGVMGTLIFHILLVGSLWIAELKLNVKTEKEEAINLDFEPVKENAKFSEPEQQKGKSTGLPHSEKDGQGSNLGVNDAPVLGASKKDKFFDDSYKRDIDEAKKMVADVNKQLSKKISPVKKTEMPEATTEGQNRDSIKNVIYSGKSNIHYFLENRFHVRLPIPVYLAKSGGEIKVDIQVDQSGKVIKAEAHPNKNMADQMLAEYAIQAAEHTVFNTDTKAPVVQKGSITYKFVPQ